MPEGRGLHAEELMKRPSTRPEVVVITGASGGVGRATAQAFGRRGAWVCLVARGEAGLDGAKRDVERLGGRAIIVAGDNADPEAHERAALQAEAEFGPIEIWVNIAFTTVFAPFTEITPEEYQRVTNVTVVGGAQTAQQCLRVGLVDAIHLGIVPIILGDGLRFFAPLDAEHSDQLQQVKLERTRILESPTRTDLWFCVVK